MNSYLYDKVRDDLCPDNIWILNDVVEKILNRRINRLPKREIDNEKVRYPDDQASMRAFLDKFFARHYFQVQNSLLEYMASEEFIRLLKIGRLNILDVGSGPAVASLAITNMLVCILKNLNNTGRIRINYFLNDIANICLGTGKELLNAYFPAIRQNNQKLLNGITLSIEEGFPSNIKRLMRIQRNYGKYDIVIFSYVITPLDEQQGLERIVEGFWEIEKMCNPNGRILVLQDKFHEALVREITGSLGKRYQQEKLSQSVYSSDNSNELQTYTYYSCLYSPRANRQAGLIAV